MERWLFGTSKWLPCGNSGPELLDLLIFPRETMNADFQKKKKILKKGQLYFVRKNVDIFYFLKFYDIMCPSDKHDISIQREKFILQNNILLLLCIEDNFLQK